MFGTSYYLIECFLSIKNHKLAFKNLTGGVLIFAFTLVQICVYSVGFIGTQTDVSKYKILNTQTIPTMGFETGYKLKDRENVYTPNIGLLTQYPTFANWIHLSSKNHYSGIYKLGYNTQSTVMYSSGGTLLTDAILGNKYVLSEEDLDENYYTKITDFSFVNSATVFSSRVKEETVKMNLYELNFDIKPLFVTDENLSGLLNGISLEGTDFFEVQNLLYKKLFLQNENILVEVPFDVVETDDNFVISATAENGKIAYLSSTLIGVEIFDSYRDLVSGINDLGTVSNGEVKIEISKKDILGSSLTIDKIKQNFKMGLFDVLTFKTVYQNYENANSSIQINNGVLNISVDNTQGKKYALIPFVYQSGLNVTLNGNNVRSATALDAFIFVELEPSVNNIVISVTQRYVTFGAIVSFVGVFLLILFMFLNTRFNLTDKKWFKNIGAYGWFICFSAIAIMIYLAPTILFFTYLF